MPEFMKIYVVDRRKATWTILKGFTMLAIVGFFVAAGFSSSSLLEAIQRDGEIYVVTRNGPTTFYMDQHGPTGFEYALAKAFSEHIGVELRIRPEETLEAINQSVAIRSAHFAAAGLTATAQRREGFKFSQPYMEVTQQLVYRFNKPESLANLGDRTLTVVAGSSHEQWLEQLRDTSLPNLTWQRTEVETVELLTMLHRGDTDYIILDSIEFETNVAFFPGLKVAFDVTDPQPIAWMLPDASDESLLRAVDNFFHLIEQDGRLLQWKERYFGNIKQVNYVGVTTFEKQLRTRLPKYQEQFQKSAEEYDLDWRLLASIGYQESHWRSRAVSPTGVKGLMMLTLTTAKEMGIKNRLNPMESIKGGAKYFARLHKRIPKRIQEPDRTWMALAAYNVGAGHLEDARKITEALEKNPDDWLDVKEHLPLLEQKKYYKFTKHGYARGREPVVYVENIRRYYDLLKWHFPEAGETPEIPPELEQLPKPEITLPPTL